MEENHVFGSRQETHNSATMSNQFVYFDIIDYFPIEWNFLMMISIHTVTYVTNAHVYIDMFIHGRCIPKTVFEYQTPKTGICKMVVSNIDLVIWPGFFRILFSAKNIVMEWSSHLTPLNGLILKQMTQWSEKYQYNIYLGRNGHIMNIRHIP